MNQADIVLISDPRVLAIAIKDNNDTLANLETFPDLKIDRRKSSSSNPFHYLRTLTVYKLLDVQSSLPSGIKLLIIEGYRPLSLQKEYFEEYINELKKKYPDWPEEKLNIEASKYVAPPSIIPPHSTGGAIDLTLCNSEGRELDMGTSINTNPEESDNACFTGAENISKGARENRNILIDAMTKHGFINYPTEWWHWSYGDRYWAYMTHQEVALLGSIELNLFEHRPTLPASTQKAPS